MRIGIIGAMEQEIALLRDQINHAVLWQQAGCNFYMGHLCDVEVVLVKSGIGKVSASLGTTLLLDHFKPEVIINTGSAGSLVSLLQIGDILLSKEVRYHDVDVTAFGYKLGQMAHCPESFNAAPFLVVLAEGVANRLGLHTESGLLISGDSFIKGVENLDYIHKNFPRAIAVDMEAAAVAHVCYLFSVPFVVVRSISDIVDQEPHLSFEKFLPVASNNSSFLVKEIVKALSDY